MRRVFLKPKVWLWGLVASILVLLIWFPLRNVLNVAAVQNAVQHDWEIAFGYSDESPARPEALPVELDSAVDGLLERVFVGRRGAKGTQPVNPRNRDVIYHERFRALFRGPIREIHVTYFEAFRGDLGAALARFPLLRSVSVFDNASEGPTEAQWTLLCKRLRALPQLEELALGGTWLTDAAIAPLAGHPQLRSLSISYGRITAKSERTFSQIPHLTELKVEDQIEEDAAE